MAIIAYRKDIELDNGATASFHVVQGIRAHFPAGELAVQVVMESYINQEAYDAGKPCLDTNTYNLTDATKLTALAAAASGAVLTIPAFSGATKV